MRVEQAVYGEVEGGGHGLRGSSSSSLAAATIAAQLDLPDGVPPGVQAWSPFIRGFSCAGHYVLARTFLDSGSSRGGMVLTHALIINLEDICQTEDLTVLIGRLAASAETIPSELSALEIEMTTESVGLPIDLIGAANVLAEQQGPAIRLGVAGFENLVVAIWRNLWPSVRKTFAFRLSFGPKDLEAQPGPTIVCTPQQLQARWTKHSVVNPDDQTPQTMVARVLCGRQDAGPFLELAVELGLEVTTIKHLNKLERLHSLITAVDSFEGLLNALRLVDGLSNRSELGRELKDDLIQRIAAQVPVANCKQLMLMRNLDLPSFADTKSLWSAVCLLVSKLDFAQTEDEDLVVLVKASADGELACPSWRTAVKDGLNAAGRQQESGIWKAIWRWTELSHTAFSTVVDVLPSGVLTEQLLVQAAPRVLDAAKATSASARFLKNGWLSVHGAALAAMMSPCEAAAQQLKVDKQPNYSEGLLSALRHATPDETLRATIDLKDQRLVEICGTLAVSHPEMLSNICCEDITEQMVWACAIENNPSLWKAPSNPLETRNRVLAQLGSSNGAFPGLLEVLPQTPLADLTFAPDRAELWQLLPATHRGLYLQKTASGWLNEAIKGTSMSVPEHELESAVLTTPNLQVVLQDSSTPLQTCLAIVSALSSFQEDTFMALLPCLLQNSRSLEQVDAIQLGTILANRRWVRAIQYLCDQLTDSRKDLLPSLQQCSSFLTYLQRWWLGVSMPSIPDKWMAFEETACDLYPTGPDHDQLWSRAGGKNSDLPGAAQNGAARWHSALRSIRFGGQPHARNLTTVMCEDFKANEKLRLIATDIDIVGKP